MSKVQQTSGEVFDSVTGHDEMAISQHFGRTISQLGEDPTMWARAMAFVVRRRDGLNDDDARNEVLAMSLKDVTKFFAAESEESGKDETTIEPSLEPSLTSVS